VYKTRIQRAKNKSENNNNEQQLGAAKRFLGIIVAIELFSLTAEILTRAVHIVVAVCHCSV